MQGAKRIITTLFLAILSFDTGAHPHSFAHLKTKIVSENDQFVALKIRWTMDEITSTGLLYDAGNAKPGDEIWKKLAAEVMANILGQYYSIEVRHGGKKVKFRNKPIEYGMERRGHQAVLTFIPPLVEAQPPSGQRYTPSAFDPTHYVDMSHGKNSDAKLEQAISQECRISVYTPTPNEQTLSFAQSPGKEDAPPEDMELDRRFAQTVTLQCQWLINNAQPGVAG